ncbi:hypothetical protein BDY24DRAFT_392546 [Mrakia frigida]|uniref:uncharacterized protein n=1 Tax=Mrakia frigida TaxID=29902 RepID=UPI003FCC21BA
MVCFRRTKGPRSRQRFPPFRHLVRPSRTSRRNQAAQEERMVETRPAVVRYGANLGRVEGWILRRLGGRGSNQKWGRRREWSESLRRCRTCRVYQRTSKN